jgi:hypothetical protein
MNQMRSLIVLGVLTATAAASLQQNNGIEALPLSELADIEAGASCYYPQNLVLPAHTCAACIQGYATWFYCNTYMLDQGCLYWKGATYNADCTLTQSPCGGSMTEFVNSTCTQQLQPPQWPPIACSRVFNDANLTGSHGPVVCP